MEIFQNLWTILITENENALRFLGIPFVIVEAALTCCLFTVLLNIRSNTKQKLTYILSISIISIFSALFIPAPYNSLINVITNITLIIVIFKLKFLKSVLAVLLPLIIFTIINIPLHNIYIAVFNLPTELLMVIPIYKLSYSSLTYAIGFFVYFILKRFNINIYLIEDMKQKTNSTLVINFLFGIAAVYLQTYISSLYSDIIPAGISLLNFGLLLFYFIFSLYSLIRTNTLERTKRDLEQSQQYNKTLTILHDNIRCFKHDFNNIVTTIGGYVHTSDLTGLKKYYNELLGDCQKVNNLSALNPAVINEPAVYSLLTNKYHLADEKGITINLEIFLDLTTLSMKTYEFTRMLRYFNG